MHYLFHKIKSRGTGADEKIARLPLSNLLTHVWLHGDRRGHRKRSKNAQWENTAQDSLLDKLPNSI